MNTIFEASKNCWRMETAQRAAFIIDGEDYFRALHEAMRRARRSIIIVGWDLHSELRMIRDGQCDGYPDKLGKFLDFLAKHHNGLRIYLLSWDFAMIYAMEREFFPRYKLKWTTHKHIQFCLDGQHPVGASQHQKIVVIDDAVAFSGGLDLSKWRWDNSAHQPDNPLRMGPDGELYPPFHDVQMVVDGEAAQALGEWVKERWQRAYGERPLIDQQIEIGDPWPLSVKPDFQQVKIAISRTCPAYEHYAEVREVERLYLDSIAAAQDFIYIENQYLSSYHIGEALKARLQQADGPEVVMVMPKKTGGWLEQHTMDVLRGRIMHKLQQADRHNHLRIYYPQLATDRNVSLMVHAKVMVIDDCFVRVGSSNLSNRSLGLDSECDLSIAAEKESIDAQAIAAFRHRLIAEHLGVAGERLAEAFAEQNTLIGAIECLRGGERTLVILNGDIPPEVDQWVPESELLDPEKPIEPEQLIEYFIGPDQQLFASWHMLKIIVLVAVFLGLAALWRWTPLAEQFDLDTAMAAAAWIKQQPYMPFLVPLFYIAGGLISFPVTLMIIATITIFGPWEGFFYSVLSAELSALVLFFIGRSLGQRTVRRFAGPLLNRLSQKLSDVGLRAVITVRIFPVAPFSVINIIAGVSRIRLQDFAVGSLIGLLPGIAVISVTAGWIADAVRHARWDDLAIALAVVVIIGIGLFGLIVWLRKQHAKKKADGGG